MARIKIEDLSKDVKLQKEDIKKLLGGYGLGGDPKMPLTFSLTDSSVYSSTDTLRSSANIIAVLIG